MAHPDGTPFYDLDKRVSCYSCPWQGTVAEARYGRQKPGSPHYCLCPECADGVEPL